MSAERCRAYTNGMVADALDISSATVDCLNFEEMDLIIKPATKDNGESEKSFIFRMFEYYESSARSS